MKLFAAILGLGIARMIFACGGAGGPASPGAAAPEASNESGSATATATPRTGTRGAQATDFTARDVDGRTVRLSDYLGKQAVLLDFWSTYCEPCLAEMPHLRRIYEANKAKGFVVLAVSMDGPETVGQVPSFAKRNGMVFPVILDEDSHIVSIYNPKKSAPLSILIDKQGRVVRVHEGYNPGDENAIAEEVAKVLDQGARAK
jgi:peroxiredoxin